MTLPELLAQLKGVGIRISADGDRLRLRGPNGSLTIDVRDALGARKSEILAFLKTATTPAAQAYPLSSAQQRLWFIEQLTPGTAAYHVARAFRLSGPLDVSALETSLRDLVVRHEVLRTTIAVVDGEPVALVSSSGAFSLPVERLGDVAQDQTEAEVTRRANDEAQSAFDLARGPLFRARLIVFDSHDHVLLLTWHHIIADGWSVGVFLQELAALYEAHLEQREPTLAPLPSQYHDWTMHERAWLRSAECDRQLEYWTKRLHGAPPVLELPADRPAREVERRDGARLDLWIEPGLRDRVRALCRSQRTTLFMALVTAFNVLLFRYTGQEDLLVGIPSANRTSVAIEGLVGLFINTLVLRTDCTGIPTFQELLARVRDAALEAYAHQDLPFDRVVAALRPARNTRDAPLFQVMFAMHDMPVTDLRFPGLSLRPIEVLPGVARLDLAVDAWEWSGGVRLSFGYDTDRFDRATIGRLAGHFRTLLAGAVASPTTRLSELPLLTEAERHEILVTWNATERGYPRNRCVHELVEAQAARAPGAVAVTSGDASLTYGELNERANQVAHRLRAMGAQPGVPVGICLDRSLDLLVGLLGVLKAGAAYLPLDAGLPRERLAFMLDDAGVRLVVTQTRRSEIAFARGAAILSLDGDARRLKDESRENPTATTTADGLCYVIYSSGSTGRPKGVLVPHRAVVNFLCAMRERPGLTDRDVLLAVTSLSFDIAGLELLLPLTVGARVVLADRATALDGRGLPALLERSGATVMQATPATWRLLLEAGGRARQDLKILCGGEALSRDLATALREAGASLWNLYGPTETTIWSTVEEVEPEPGPVLIGRPIANTRVYVLDRHSEPTPIGIPGELFIGGDGVAHGYLGRPALTAERFLPDPFCERPDARMYRTGDLARFRPDGRLEYLGRIDDQVKIRGVRVELGEVEATLSRFPGLRQVVVLARKDESAEPRLAAYVTLKDAGAPPSVHDVRAFMAAHVPAQMIPSTFTVLADFPLTANGKIDRRRLPHPGAVPAPMRRGVAAPRDAVDRQVLDIWQHLLGTAPIGIADDFFELGGHSLLAVRVLLEIERVFGVRLPLPFLFEHPTVAAVADALRMTKDDASRYRSLVVFRSAGGNVPIFAVHAGAGYVAFYQALARALGEEQPFYGLQAPAGLDGTARPYGRYRSVAQLARLYVSEVRRIWPHGPYVLAGACAGGPIALEMAQQLQATGAVVAPLLIFDSWLATRESVLERAQRHWRVLEDLTALQRIRYVGGRLKKTLAEYRTAGRTRLQRALRLQIIRLLSRVRRQPVPQAIIDELFLRASESLAVRYRPRPFAGRVLLFRARTSSGRSLLPDDSARVMGWGRIPGCEALVIDMPGPHLDAFAESSATEVARIIQERLDGVLHGMAIGARSSDR
jgi:amino acid adenylation domain-containing protein